MDLIKSTDELIISITELINWLPVGIKSGTDLIKSATELIKSASDRVKSLYDLIISVMVGVNPEADLIKSVTELTQWRTDFIPITRFGTLKLPAKNRFQRPPAAHLPAARRVAPKTVISERDSWCIRNIQVCLSRLWHVTCDCVWRNLSQREAE
jgi:hypothetical protein